MTTREQQIGIFTTDVGLRVRSWDAWLARVTGLSAAAVYGQPLTQVVPDLDARGLRKRFERVLSEGVVEVLAPAFHGHLIPCAPVIPSRHFATMQQWLTIAPLREDDRVVGTIVTIEDVTERLDRERDLAAQLNSPDEAIRLQVARELETATSGADLLVDAIGDSSWRVRQTVVGGLARHGGPEAGVALIEALRAEHRNPSVLNSALQVLALIDFDVIEPLIECLNASEADLRIYAALALGERHDPRAIHRLIRSLDDPDSNMRYQVIESLGKLRAAEAVDALLAIAESRDFFLAFPAIDALTRIGDPRAGAPLVPLLEDDLLRAPAAEALGHLGDDAAVAPLVTLLNKPTAPTQAIVQALAALHNRYEQEYGEGSHIADLVLQSIAPDGVQNLLDALEYLQPNDLPALVLVLGWLHEPAVLRALARLLGQPAVRRTVIEALVRHGTRVTELLTEQLASEDLEVRQAAIVALGQIGDAGAVPALIQALNDDPELSTAAGALGAIGDPRAFEALLSLVGHPIAAVRQAAIGALNSLGHPDLARRTRVLLDDPDPHVRESAVRIAGYFGYASCVDAMLARCNDIDERVRRAAIEHLPYLEDSRVLPTLAAALHQAPPGVRAAAARALAHVESGLALPHLLAALDDSDAWVRYFAARALGQHANPEAIDAIARLAQADVANHVRIAALETLGRIGGARAVALLAPLAATDDPDIARAALGALGMTAHPEALPSLEAALRLPDTARRSAALHGLAIHGSAGAVAALRSAAAADTDAQVVQAAVDALAQVGNEPAIDALVVLAAKPACRDMCVAALAHLGEERIAWIARGLAHADPVIRSTVVEALARMKRPRASEYIQAALSDPAPSVRAAAARALGQLGSRLAERQLVELARSDPDLAVRRVARAALQR